MNDTDVSETKAERMHRVRQLALDHVAASPLCKSVTVGEQLFTDESCVVAAAGRDEDGEPYAYVCFAPMRDGLFVVPDAHFTNLSPLAN